MTADPGIATDLTVAAERLAEVVTDPPTARRKTVVAKQTRTHGSVAAALKETILRSTVRLFNGIIDQLASRFDTKEK